MNRKSVFSFIGVLVAGVASVATSAPEPDWVLDDTAEGDVTITEQDEYKIVKLRVTSEVVDSNLSFDVTLEPTAATPASWDSAAVAKTPIVLFVGQPVEVGNGGPTYYAAQPGTSGPTAFLAPKTGAREVEVRIAWKSPFERDSRVIVTTSTESSYESHEVVRTNAPKKTTTVHWKASVSADGYDDKPRGAKVDVQGAP